MKRIAIAVCLAALALAGPVRLRADDGKAKALFEAGLSKETIQGDLKGAIEQYQKAVKEAGPNHALAVKALLQIAECYQKLGDSQSRKVYEQIVRDYPDQKDAVATARTKLASSQTAPARSGITLRQVWSGRAGNDGISPDGRYLSYLDLSSGLNELAIRDLSNGENRILDKVDMGSFINRSMFSPDGKQVAYEVTTNGGDPSREEQLRIVNVDGSGARTLSRWRRSDKIEYLTPATWPAGGRILVITNGPSDNIAELAEYPVGLEWVSVADGSGQTVRTQHRVANLSVAVSPDGRFIAYEGAPEGSGKNAIYVASADGSREFPLVESPWQDHVLGWTPDGSGVLFSSNRTGAMGVWWAAIKNGAANGTPIMIKDDLGKSAGMQAPAVLWPVGVTSSGSLFYSTGGYVSEMYSIDLDPATGKASGKPMPVGPSSDLRDDLPAWSPDGRQLAYSSIFPTLQSGRSPRLLHIYSPDTHNQRDLDAGVEYLGCGVAWFPDSRSLLVWGVSAQGQHGLYKIDTNSSKADMMVPMETGPAFLSLSKDGKTAYYAKSTPSTGGGQAHPDLYSRDLETGEEKLVYGDMVGPFALSPDARSLAFLTDMFPSAVLMVMPVYGGQPREVFRTRSRNLTGAEYGLPWSSDLAWSSDGRNLYLSHNDSSSPPGLWRIPVEGGAPEDVGIAMQVDTISVRPDGSGIAFNAVPVPRYVTLAIDNIRP